MTIIEFFNANGSLIQTGAIIVSAIAAVILIIHNGRLSKKRCLIDLIVEQKNNERLVEDTRLVFSLAGKNSNTLSKYACLSGNEETPEFIKNRQAILNVLNNFEFIAVGIRLGAFDEKVYKQLQCGNLLKLWNATAGFIHELRRVSGRYTVFQDIEHLAHKWEKSPIKQIH